MASWMKPRARLGFTALACVAAAALPATAGAAPASISNLVLHAYQAGTSPSTKPVVSHSRLATHGLYVATVQGTLSYYAAIDYTAIQPPWEAMCGVPASAPMFGGPGGSGPVGNDAEFIFAQPTKLASCATEVFPRHWFNLQVNVGAGWSHPKLLSAGALNAPTASHSYEYALVGRHKPASFRLTDPDTRDDYGSLHISIRRAVSGDCTGPKYKAFHLSTMQSCTAAAPTSGPTPAALPARPAITLNQGPITNVLRSTDVPKAKNLELPSGALTASEFVTASGLTRAASHVALPTLQADGFVSAAISGFTTSSGQTLTSTALKLNSPRRAEAALAAWESIAAHDQAPKGATAAVTADTSFRQGLVVTFTPSVSASPNGLEVLAAEGDYLYTLRAAQHPNVVSQAEVDALLHTVIARG
jgi:hypothetical protein